MYGIKSAKYKHHLAGKFLSFKEASDYIKEWTRPSNLYRKDELKIYYYLDRKEEMMWNLVLDLLIKGENVAVIIEQLEEVINKIKAGHLTYSSYVEGEAKQPFEIEYEIRKAKE